MSLLKEDHHGERDSQIDGIYGADGYTGIAVPAFLRIGYSGHFAGHRTEINVALTGLSARQATGAQVFVDYRGHVVSSFETEAGIHYGS